MKFSHIADVHLGSWREPQLAELNSQAFVKAIDVSLERGVDFLLLAGDLFNTSVPSIDVLKAAVTQLQRLKKRGIPVYAIAGSHDFSPSGKTMLEVLEEADLIKNVCRGDVTEGKLILEFTTDKKTGAKITGMIGKKGMLDRKYYENLDAWSLGQEPGFKIFMFHTAIDELKTEELEKMESSPISLLPRGFDYYAGGHVHIVRKEDIDGYRNVVYPGPVFPNSFAELEKLRHGSMYIYEDGDAERIDLKMSDVKLIDQDCDGMSAAQAMERLLDRANIAEMQAAVVLLRLHGTLDSGRASDINLKEITSIMEAKGARCVLKNTNKLATREFQEIKINAATPEETEKAVIKEHLGQAAAFTPEQEKAIVETLLLALDTEKREGEKAADYEKRVSEEARKTLNL